MQTKSSEISTTMQFKRLIVVIVFVVSILLTFYFYFLTFKESSEVISINQKTPRVVTLPKWLPKKMARKNGSKTLGDTACVNFNMDPYHPSITKFFDDKPFRACPQPKRRTAFKTLSNTFWMDETTLKEDPPKGNCSYSVIEEHTKAGEKDKSGRGPQVPFDPKTKVTVNATFVVVECPLTNAPTSKPSTSEKGVKWRKDKRCGTIDGKPVGCDPLGEHPCCSPRGWCGNTPQHCKCGSCTDYRSVKRYFVNLPYRALKIVDDKNAQKIKKPSTSTRPFSVFVIGLDSASRLNSKRHLKKTRDFLLNQLNAIEFLAYNRVGKNTIPNFTAMFTGQPVDYDVYLSRRHIWEDFADRGFWTIFGDDWDATAWGYSMKNFAWDFYFRAAAREMGLKKVQRNDCFEGRRHGDILYDWFSNFLEAHRAFPDDSLFAWIFAAEWTHQKLNELKMVDDPTLQLLMNMKSKGDLDNAVLIFLSDHGFRFGSYPRTHMGAIETNLPLLFFAFPSWFEAEYPQLIANVRVNARRLVTAFDIHETLQHLLRLSTTNASLSSTMSDNRMNDPSISDAKSQRVLKQGHGLSFLNDEIPVDRTCEEAGIPDTFCSCYFDDVINLELNTTETLDAARTFVAKVNAALVPVRDICAPLTLKRVLKSQKFPAAKKLKLQIAVAPSDANLEAFIADRGVGGGGGSNGDVSGSKNFDVKISEVSRLDKYGDTTKCVMKRDKSLKEFCHCIDKKKTTKKVEGM